jgi:hypothetical protein
MMAPDWRASVVEYIRCEAHQEPVEIEAVLLRDADILEQPGCNRRLARVRQGWPRHPLRKFFTCFDIAEACFERFTIENAPESCETSFERAGSITTRFSGRDRIRVREHAVLEPFQPSLSSTCNRNACMKVSQLI